VPEPAGFAFLSQEIEPDDYRGCAVTFRGDLRTTDVADRAGLVLRIPRQGRRPAPPDPWHDPENHFAPVTGTRDWTRHEVTAQVPADAISIIFGVFLNGRGQIELRNPQLEPHPQKQSLCARNASPTSRHGAMHTRYAARPAAQRRESGTLCDEHRVIFVAASGQVRFGDNNPDRRGVTVNDYYIADRNAGRRTRHTQIRRVTSSALPRPGALICYRLTQ
jgi:hypothetical protein